MWSFVHPRCALAVLIVDEAASQKSTDRLRLAQQQANTRRHDVRGRHTPSTRTNKIPPRVLEPLVWTGTLNLLVRVSASLLAAGGAGGHFIGQSLAAARLRRGGVPFGGAQLRAGQPGLSPVVRGYPGERGRVSIRSVVENVSSMSVLSAQRSVSSPCRVPPSGLAFLV